MITLINEYKANNHNNNTLINSKTNVNKHNDHFYVLEDHDRNLFYHEYDILAEQFVQWPASILHLAAVCMYMCTHITNKIT